MQLYRVFILVFALGLMGGLVGDLAYGQIFGEAGAAPPVPSPTTVLEQNVDTDGLIRIHEQGTAKVTVENLPAVQDVNVVPTPVGPAGRLIDLGEYRFDTIIDTPLVAVDDCASITAMTKQVSGDALVSLSIWPRFTSPDGTTRVWWYNGASGIDGRADGVATGSVTGHLAVPWAAWRIDTSSNFPTGATIHAWAWCDFGN